MRDNGTERTVKLHSNDNQSLSRGTGIGNTYLVSAGRVLDGQKGHKWQQTCGSKQTLYLYHELYGKDVPYKSYLVLHVHVAHYDIFIL